jgi:O-antigen/teichoic acid export membrane protein
MTAPTQRTVLARAAVGANWLIAWRMTNRVLGLASMLISVRLLAPEDFGLITLAFSVSQAVETFTSVGAHLQIIRSRRVDDDLYDTVLTFNVVRSLLVAAVVAVSSRWAAAWFGDPRLADLLLAVALYVVLTGFANTRVFGFQRDLLFGRVFVVNALPRLIQVVATILLVVTIRNYWAIISGMLVGAVATLVVGYALAPCRPRLTFASWRELLSVSTWTWLTSIAGVARDRTEMFVIGRVFGTVQAGYYSIALDLAMLPMSEIVGPISHAAMSGFAEEYRAQGAGQTAATFLRVMSVTLLLGIAMGTGLSLTAGPAISLLTGPRWAQTAALLMVFGIALIPMAPGAIAFVLLTAQARLKTQFATTLVAAVLRSAIVIGISRHWGLSGIAVGMGVGILVENGLLVIAACRALSVRLWRVLADLWRPALAAVAMAAALWWAGLAWLPPPPSAGEAARLLAAAVALGAGVFASVSGGLWLLLGRPPGAEADVLLLGKKVSAGLSGRIRARLAR